MISYEEFETLVDLLKKSYEESRRFNKALEEVYGEDSCVWYYKQYDIVADHLVQILELNGESHDGAEWFVYDGLEQIEKGGTEIGYDDKWYNIKTIRDYYDWLMNFSKHNTNTSEMKCCKCGKTLTAELKKEAEELYRDWYAHKLGAISIIDVICKIAEPREKQILALQKQNGELTDKVKELEAQIEKMKYALNKIIKTVQNDNISGYGDRLVKIYDISCEVLQEIKEK